MISCKEHGRQAAYIVCLHVLAGHLPGHVLVSDPSIPGPEGLGEILCRSCYRLIHSEKAGEAELDMFQVACGHCAGAFLSRVLPAMMHPESGNIGFRAGPAPKKENTHQPSFYLGKNVKRAFVAEDGRIEHMWVKVDGLTTEGMLTGRLANSPLYDVGVKHGDRVEVKVDEIEDLDANSG